MYSITTEGCSKIAVFAAITATLIIAIIKFIAAALLGSSAMIVEVLQIPVLMRSSFTKE